MQKPDIYKLVLARLLPTKDRERDTTPRQWRSFVHQFLIPEIEGEKNRFYGTDCIEAQNPGLDYAKPAHRLRLQAFDWHRRLFEIFDELRLSKEEIQALCKWQYTKRAKEKYEAENHIKIRDTTWDGVAPYIFQEPTAIRSSHMRGGGDVYVGAEQACIQDEISRDGDYVMDDPEDGNDGEDEEYSEDESEDELQQSVGVELNERLLAATEARARGEAVPIDAAYEQWLKEAEENGMALVPPSTSPPAGPAEQWGREIPEIFSDNTGPHIAALQERLSPPPQYDADMHSPNSTVSAILGSSTVAPNPVALVGPVQEQA